MIASLPAGSNNKKEGRRKEEGRREEGEEGSACFTSTGVT
jgi:hypothetical protein